MAHPAKLQSRVTTGRHGPDVPAMTRVRRMILLAASICLAQIGPAFRAAGQDNPTDGEREALPSTAYARALTNRPSYRNRKPPPPPPPSPGAGQVALTAALAIAGILSLRKVVPRTVDFLNSRFNHPLSSQQTPAEARLSLLAEDPGLSEFFCT